MAAYYQQPRQRQPLPTESQLGESPGSAPLTPHEVQQLESFLIFPEPAAASRSVTASSALGTSASGGKRNAVQLSPAPSTLSIHTSLLASVARRSRSREHTLSQRSVSVDWTPSETSSDWEALKGPLPRPPASFILPSRGRQSRRTSAPPTSPRALSGSDEDDDESARIAGIGWEWTLDTDEQVPPRTEIRPDDLLSGWRWTSSRSSSGGDEKLGEERSLESRHEDAISHFPDGLGLAQQDRAEQPSKRTEPSMFLQVPQTPQARSLRLSSPTRRRIREARARRPVSPPRHTIIPSPFRTIIQAVFSIDQSTLDLIDQVGSEGDSSVQCQPTTLFGLRDDILATEGSGHTTPANGRSAAQARELESQVRLLLSDGPESALATDRMLAKGFSASHLMTINPFTMPLVLLNIGWEYGLKGLLMFRGTAGT